jgi:peptide-methionine (S)-S-oxide reductase
LTVTESLMTPARKSPYLLPTLFIGALLIGAGSSLKLLRSAEAPHVIPSPALDEQASAQSATTEITVLAGGCFWGVQGVFQHINGVTSAVSGYAGGDKKTAKYETVGSGRTGHAESVRIRFNPRKISFGRILQIYFSVVHDPTQLNRQGPDYGPQYRSVIFPTSVEQARVAKAYIDQLNQARVYNAAIVTKIEPDKKFSVAEDYHQDFLTRHPSYPYIVYNDLPKLDALKRLFPDDYRLDPVLVAAKTSN